MPIVLCADNLHKDFPTGHSVVHAVRGVSFDADAGEFVVLMGASGSGKSTVLHLLGGLDLPTAGSARIQGRDLGAMNDAERTFYRRDQIGIVFQSFNLLPALTARENISLPRTLAGASAREAGAKADELLKIVDLGHRANHRPQAMSGGEQQRVAIARALVNDPVVVLADEPTGNLDSTHAIEVWRLLRRLADERRCTVVAVTHESFGAAHADRVLVLKDGRAVGRIDLHGEHDAALVAARYQELAG